MAEQQAIQTFFVTLRRSYINRPWFHKQVLESLGLKRRHQCVEKPNNATIRGQLRKVAHLVNIETDQMYLHRKLSEHASAELRPPLVVSHGAAAFAGATNSSRAVRAPDTDASG